MASAGVLYVWSRREFSSAIARSSDDGTQRFDARMRGEHREVERAEDARDVVPAAEEKDARRDAEIARHDFKFRRARAVAYHEEHGARMFGEDEARRG